MIDRFKRILIHEKEDGESTYSRVGRCSLKNMDMSSHACWMCSKDIHVGECRFKNFKSYYYRIIRVPRKLKEAVKDA